MISEALIIDNNNKNIYLVDIKLKKISHHFQDENDYISCCKFSKDKDSQFFASLNTNNEIKFINQWYFYNKSQHRQFYLQLNLNQVFLLNNHQVSIVNLVDNVIGYFQEQQNKQIHHYYQFEQNLNEALKRFDQNNQICGFSPYGKIFAFLNPNIFLNKGPQVQEIIDKE